VFLAAHQLGLQLGYTVPFMLVVVKKDMIIILYAIAYRRW